jgi:hypothetical protein
MSALHANLAASTTYNKVVMTHQCSDSPVTEGHKKLVYATGSAEGDPTSPCLLGATCRAAQLCALSGTGIVDLHGLHHTNYQIITVAVAGDAQ